MSNFELIDDYLTNRLGEQEKLEFERQLGSDPSLKADVELQKHILEGVKNARIADLKAMLNNVPVGMEFSSAMTAGKIAAAVATVAIVGATLYFYLRPAKNEPSSLPVITEQEPGKGASEPATSDSAALRAARSALESIAIEPKKPEVKVSKGKTIKKSPATKKPNIEVIDPSDELVNKSPEPVNNAETQKSAITLSHIAVETNPGDKKYDFHYQFKSGKLTLYGSFDKSLYEILEIHGDNHAVFLFYKESYYLLDEKQSKITALEPIKDATLLKKLKEYRGR